MKKLHIALLALALLFLVVMPTFVFGTPTSSDRGY